MELPFDLFVKGIYYGRVWLTHSETADFEPLGRAVSGPMRYRLKTIPNAIYREVVL